MAQIAWEKVRHQVAIAGRVSDANTGRAIGRARLQIVAAPAAFIESVLILARLFSLAGAPAAILAERGRLDDPIIPPNDKLAAAQKVLDYLHRTPDLEGPGERPDHLWTAADGHFHFLDLPAGEYSLEATLPTAPMRYGSAQAVVTVHRDGQGDVTSIGLAPIQLPSTALKGKVTRPNPDGNPPVIAMAMAEIRVKGSGESALSNGEGHYLLAPLEKGERIVEFSATGFQAVPQTVQLGEGATVELNVLLQPLS